MPNQKHSFENLPSSFQLLSSEEAEEKLKNLKAKDLDKPEFVFRHLLDLMKIDVNSHSASVEKEDRIWVKKLVTQIVIIGLKAGKKMLKPENRNLLLRVLEELHEKLENKLFNLSAYNGTLVSWLTIYKGYLEAVCNTEIGKGKRSLAKFGRITLNLDEKKNKAKESIEKIDGIMASRLFEKQSLSSQRPSPAAPSSCAQSQLGASS